MYICKNSLTMRKSFLPAFLLAMLFTAALLASCMGGRASEIRVMTFNIRLSPNESFDGDNCWNNRLGKTY